MSELKVEHWINWYEAEKYPISIGFMGGWFGTRPDPNDHSKFPRSLFDASHRWKDYLAFLKEVDIERMKDQEMWLGRTLNYTLQEYAEAFRKEILSIGLWVGGDWHQHQGGVPLFSDGTVGSWSYRAWGDIMAAIWSEYYDKDYNYMDFYCCVDRNEKPKEDKDGG